MIDQANHSKNLEALKELLKREKENFAAFPWNGGIEHTQDSEMWSDYIEEIENEIDRLENENPNN